MTGRMLTAVLVAALLTAGCAGNWRAATAAGIEATGRVALDCAPATLTAVRSAIRSGESGNWLAAVIDALPSVGCLLRSIQIEVQAADQTARDAARTRALAQGLRSLRTVE